MIEIQEDVMMATESSSSANMDTDDDNLKVEENYEKSDKEESISMIIEDVEEKYIKNNWHVNNDDEMLVPVSATIDACVIRPIILQHR